MRVPFLISKKYWAAGRLVTGELGEASYQFLEVSKEIQ